MIEMKTRITVEEIVERLGIGRDAVYELLERREIPALRPNRRWIIGRHAYLEWERTMGTQKKPHLDLARLA